GLPFVRAVINVSPTAIPGARNIIISNGSQRTIMTGGLELAAGLVSPSVSAVVSSANFTSNVAAESIASVFGLNLAPTTLAATGGSLPTTLGGASIRLRDSVGNEKDAPLFFVSPTQINYQIAPGIQIGNTTITVNNGTGATSSGSFQLAPVAPGI